MTSVRLCKLDFRLRAIWISASKNRSNFPANALFARRAPFAAVWIQPNDSVHHETMRLVSLNLRFRSRMPVVPSIGGSSAPSLDFVVPFPMRESSDGALDPPNSEASSYLIPFLQLGPKGLQGRVEIAAKE